MVQTILVGVDGSEPGLWAVDWAAAEAARRGFGLRLLTASGKLRTETAFVWPEDLIKREGQSALDQAEARARATAPEVEVESSLVVDTPAEALLKEAENAAMVVVGLRGRGEFPGMRIGSVAYQVAAHASVPAVVVGPEPGADAKPEVVVGTDGSECSQHALAAAFDAAACRGVAVHAVRAWAKPPLLGSGMRMLGHDAESIRKDESAALERDLQRWREEYPDVEVVREVVESQPVIGLIRAAEQACLLVVGARGRRGFPRLALGGVAHGILHHAPCPVMVVHTPKS